MVVIDIPENYGLVRVPLLPAELLWLTCAAACRFCL